MYHVFSIQSLHNLCQLVVNIQFAPAYRTYPLHKAILSQYPPFTSIWLEHVTGDIICATISHLILIYLFTHTIYEKENCFGQL